MWGEWLLTWQPARLPLPSASLYHKVKVGESSQFQNTTQRALSCPINAYGNVHVCVNKRWGRQESHLQLEKEALENRSPQWPAAQVLWIVDMSTHTRVYAILNACTNNTTNINIKVCWLINYSPGKEAWSIQYNLIFTINTPPSITMQYMEQMPLTLWWMKQTWFVLGSICKLLQSDNLFKQLLSKESQGQVQHHIFCSLLLRNTCITCAFFSIVPASGKSAEREF